MDETCVQESVMSPSQSSEESSDMSSEKGTEIGSVNTSENPSDKPVSKSSYANARTVLPDDVLEAVQQHYTGLLWIPRSERDPRFYRERRRLVLQLKRSGVSTVEIARLAGVTPRRVRQIVARERRLGTLGEANQRSSERVEDASMDITSAVGGGTDSQ